MFIEAWVKLWEKTEGVASITTTLDPYRVILVWPDGSTASLYYDGEWRFEEGINMAPGDVAARDSL